MTAMNWRTLAIGVLVVSAAFEGINVIINVIQTVRHHKGSMNQARQNLLRARTTSFSSTLANTGPIQVAALYAGNYDTHATSVGSCAYRLALQSRRGQRFEVAVFDAPGERKGILTGLPTGEYNAVAIPNAFGCSWILTLVRQDVP